MTLPMTPQQPAAAAVALPAPPFLRAHADIRSASPCGTSADSRPSGEDVRGPLRAGKARVARDQQMQRAGVVAGHIGEHFDAAVGLEVAACPIFARVCLFLLRAPARVRPSPCCNGSGRCRPRPTHRRCRRTCRPRSCGRCDRAPRRCRRSCIRSSGRRRLRPPPWRRNCGPRSARRQCRGNSIRRRSRRTARCCRR